MGAVTGQVVLVAVVPGDRAEGTVVDSPNGTQVSAALRRTRETVRLVRAQRHLTQRQAAEQIGMINTELCRFERGTLNPTLTTLLKITDWIGDDRFDDLDQAIDDIEHPNGEPVCIDTADQKVGDLLAALEESVNAARDARRRQKENADG